jgi:hypothetical protein
MFAGVTGDMLYPVRFTALAAIGAMVSVLHRRSHPARKWWAVNDGRVMIALSIAFAVSVASTDWVIRNLYEWRYWTVPVALIFLTIASVVADRIYVWLHRLVGSTAISATVSLLVFAASIIQVFGLPSPRAARASLESASGADYDKVVRLNCTHMIGNYWIAWSSVFHNRSRRIQPPLWAVSLRSEATEDLWSRIPPGERRYCGVCGDTMNNYYEIVFKLGPLRHTDQADSICLYQK